MISQRHDAYLVRAALDGDGEAYGELARRHRKVAFGIALGRLGDYDAALDVAQEALVAAYVQLPVLREHERFAAWLCRMTLNLALMRLRRVHSELSLDSPYAIDTPTPEPGPSDLAERIDETSALYHALAQLPDSDRAAVTLHYVSGYTHEEIAEMTGVSASSIKARLHRARRRLREEMLTTMEAIGDRLPEVEMTEEVLEGLLQRHDLGEGGVIVHIGGYPGAVTGMPLYTDRTKDALVHIAAKLKNDGCRRLYAIPHIPDGSPALAMFRSLGFENEKEMLWYERDLSTRQSPAPPLPEGFELRPIRDVPIAGVVELFRAPLRKYPADLVERRAAPDPESITEEWAAGVLRGGHLVLGGSIAVCRGDLPVAGVIAFGVTEWENWKYEPGTGVLWVLSDCRTSPELLVPCALTASLRGLKKARLRRAVVDQIDRGDCEPWLIPSLEGAGFAYVRSQWNLRLPLNEPGWPSSVCG